MGGTEVLIWVRLGDGGCYWLLDCKFIETRPVNNFVPKGYRRYINYRSQLEKEVCCACLPDGFEVCEGVGLVFKFQIFIAVRNIVIDARETAALAIGRVRRGLVLLFGSLVSACIPRSFGVWLVRCILTICVCDEGAVSLGGHRFLLRCGLRGWKKKVKR